MRKRPAEKLSQILTNSLLVFALVFGISACGGGGSGGSESPVTQNPTPDPVPDLTPTADGVISVVARAGPITRLRVGETAILDGSKSVTNSDDALSYDWSFSSKPDASDALLQDATTANPSFTADASGTYVAQLVVAAEGISSKRAISLVVATEPPALNVFHQGLSTNCVNCHNPDFLGIPEKTASHVSTSNTCETCHTPLGFTIVAVDHLEVFGNCSDCHNGLLAVGKSEFHAPTNAECDDCHNTTHFLELGADGSFDHSGILRSCSGCHNGGLAIGKTPSPPHPDTNGECGECHTTTSFENAYPDHSGPEVVGVSCDSCHGVSAAGQSEGHPQTNVDCAVCHSTATFSLGGIFNHRVIDAAVQSCESCHNDNTSINAPAKSAAVPAHPLTAEDCGVCHNTDSFADAVFDHSGIIDDCASCHGVTASGKSANHLPTSEDCSICHTPGTFTTGIYDHFGVINGCEMCHDNVITIGKLSSHLPTTQLCAECHNTTDFADATFDHIGIDTSDCALCHDGQIAPGKPSSHLPTVLDCSSCHDINNFNSFAGIVFSHVGIDPNNCAVCHATGIATPKISNHIPAAQECSGCHDSTVDFASSVFLITVHSGIDQGCSGCHQDQFFPDRPDLLQAADHLPTLQDCSVCHINSSFTPATFDHVGITGDCASCHDGNPAYVGLGALAMTDIPVHQNTTSDCSVCHNTNSFAEAFVDHTGPEVLGNRCDSCHNGINATGKDAFPDHVATSEDCGVCHVAGGSFTPAVFNHDGIIANCASCHNGTDATGKDAKIDPPHIPTSEDCSVCHTPTAFANANFDHQNIVDNCASCHNGNTAIGKSFNHVPTNADCGDCHVTTGFLPASFDHVGIVDNCASCHDAGFATGKGDGHLATNQDCGVCHNISGFVPATFDHTGIVDNCASCHGVSARGMSPDHIPTALDCSFCHTTATFVGGTFDHQGINDGCESCHNGVIAIGSEPQGINDHFITNAQCIDCHSTQGWAPVNYTHPAASDYPGDHGANLGCRSCHADNDEAINYRWNQYAPFCAACHANDFERKGDHIGGENGTVEQNKDCSNGGRGCHRVSDRNFD